MRLERLTSIVFLLLNRKRISATKLAERFNVSIRTIYRDINTIDQAGIPIISHTGQQGGFAILDTYCIDKQVLTLNEITSIINTLKGVNASLEDEDMKLTIEKIGNLMPRSPSSETRMDEQPLTIDLFPWGYSEHYKKMMKRIYHSIKNCTLITIKYSKPDNIKISRTIEPMTLLYKGYTWYLFAFCRLRKDYRIFRLSRIKKMKEHNQSFTRRRKNYKDLPSWSDNSSHKIEITLQFSSQVKTVVEDFFREEQLSYQDDGSIVVKEEFPKNDWLYGFILSFGEYVKVLKPSHLRDIISEKAKKISKIYEP